MNNSMNWRHTMTRGFQTDPRRIALPPFIAIGLFGLAATTIVAIGHSGAADAGEIGQAKTEQTSAQTSNKRFAPLQLAQNQQQKSGHKGRRGPPPKEAFAACKGKTAKSECSFTDSRRNRKVEGQCGTSPRGETLCIPADAPPRRS